MKSIINLALAFSLFLLASCEGNTEYLLNVKNNSSETLTIVPDIEWSYTTFEDSIQLAVGETKLIAQWNMRGGNPRSIDISSHLSTAQIYGVQTSAKVLDSSVYRSNARWKEDIETKSKRPANYWHHYELTLTDADFW